MEGKIDERGKSRERKSLEREEEGRIGRKTGSRKGEITRGCGDRGIRKKGRKEKWMAIEDEERVINMG